MAVCLKSGEESRSTSVARAAGFCWAYGTTEAVTFPIRTIFEFLHRMLELDVGAE